jgi:prepilin-type N-terminal cleavage/methylation domain-containing protein
MIRTRRQGFTLIEVMMTVAIITIGATGLFAMQGATVRANAEAEEATVATAFASSWIERLKRDGLTWTARGSLALANSQNLKNLVGCTANTWVVPTSSTPQVESALADFHGFDIDTTAPAADRPRGYYCANVSVSPVHGMGADRSLPITNPDDADLLRVTVRVWWARGGRGGADVSNLSLSPGARGCVVPADEELTSPTLRTVYLSTLVHWNRVR